MTPILCEHLQLRPWQPEDAPSLAEQANNRNIWNNVRDIFPHPYTPEDARAYIELAANKPRIEDMAIVVEGRAVGGLGFVPQNDVERYNAELGYWIGEAYWGRGLASEAVAGFIPYVFGQSEIKRLFAWVYDRNYGSMRVLEKNGFRKVGVMQQSVCKNGLFLDCHYYELLK